MGQDELVVGVVVIVIVLLLVLPVLILMTGAVTAAVLGSMLKTNAERVARVSRSDGPGA